MRTVISRAIAVAALVAALVAAAAVPAAAVPAAAAPATTPAATVSTAPAGTPRPLSGPPCEPGKLCVFDQPNFTGNRHDYYQCGPMRDVRQDGLERIGSFINNQTDDQVSTFYGEDAPHHWVPQFTSVAAGADQDTTDRRTLGVQVC